MGKVSEKPVSTSFESFELELTYGGLMEGSREALSQRLRDSLRKEFPTNGTNNGHALVMTDAPCLPNWICKAYLSSSYRFDDEDEGSRLSICWFIDEPKDSIQEMIDEVLKQVDWRARARRYMSDF